MKRKKNICPFLLVGIGLLFLFACTKTDVEDTPEEIVEDTIFTVFDIDGNGYHSIIIGEQEWMLENLKVTRFNDSTPIPYGVELGMTGSDETSTFWWYDNDEAAHKEKYGALYNWHAVNTGKLAPEGWHVPSDEEWSILEDYLIANGHNFDCTFTENKLAKSMATATGWRFYDVKGTTGSTDYPHFQNLSGFSAVPAGHAGYDGKFYGLGERTSWWSSSIAYDPPNEQVHLFNAFERSISYCYRDVWRRYHSKCMGYSVRCIKNSPVTTNNN